MPERMPKKRPHHQIAAAFVVIGGMLGIYAVDGGGWYLALLWPASNCLAVGFAYLGPAGAVFGKRKDGTFRPWIALPMLPFLLVTWATWHAQILLSREAAWHEVYPGVFLGRRAYEHELPDSVNMVIDMTAEFGPPKYAEGRNYVALPTLDAFVPNENDFIAFARMAARHPEGVFVHCANGHGRSAAMVAAILIAKGAVPDIDGAEEMIMRSRPLCAWHPVQRALLVRVAAKLNS